MKTSLLNSLLLTQFIFADFKGIFCGKECPGISYEYLCPLNMTEYEG